MDQKNSSGIRCIDANKITPNIAAGHENGLITVFDYSAKKIIHSTQVENQSIESIQYINNGLQLVVGMRSGKIQVFDTKEMKLLSIVNDAHLVKSEEGVNCLASIETLENQESQENNSNGQLPFFVSGGADSMIKIFEHNPYMPVIEDDTDN